MWESLGLAGSPALRLLETLMGGHGPLEPFLSLSGTRHRPTARPNPPRALRIVSVGPDGPRAARLLRAHGVESSTSCSAGTRGLAHLAVSFLKRLPRVPALPLTGLTGAARLSGPLLAWSERVRSLDLTQMETLLLLSRCCCNRNDLLSLLETM